MRFYRRHVKARYRRYRSRVRHFIFHTVLHADDPPHRLALGLAVGMFVTFTPTVGFQMVITFILAWLLRANKVVGPPLVWLSNPITIPPMFFFNYWVGAIIMGGEIKDYDYFVDIVNRGNEAPSWWDKVVIYWVGLWDIFAELWIGSVIVGLAAAIPTYVISYYAIRWYRIRRWGQVVPPPLGQRVETAVQQGKDDSRPLEAGSKPH